MTRNINRVQAATYFKYDACKKFFAYFPFFKTSSYTFGFLFFSATFGRILEKIIKVLENYGLDFSASI